MATKSGNPETTERAQQVKMDLRDYKIFMAMLSNLESFLKDAHMKAMKMDNPLVLNISWKVDPEKSQAEKDLASLEDLYEKAVQDDDPKTYKVLGPIIERMKASK